MLQSLVALLLMVSQLNHKNGLRLPKLHNSAQFETDVPCKPPKMCLQLLGNRKQWKTAWEFFTRNFTRMQTTHTPEKLTIFAFRNFAFGWNGEFKAIGTPELSKCRYLWEHRQNRERLKWRSREKSNLSLTLSKRESSEFGHSLFSFLLKYSDFRAKFGTGIEEL